MRENGHFFRKKPHSEILVPGIFFRPPQTRRQVSTTDYRENTKLRREPIPVSPTLKLMLFFQEVPQKLTYLLNLCDCMRAGSRQTSSR